MSVYVVSHVLIIYLVLIGVGLSLFVLCLYALIWAIRSGQYEDLETPALRMLHDDEPAPSAAAEPHDG